MAEGKSWRKIFSFSKRDQATQQWWEAQENPSVSLQLLIREDIERNGFSDKLNAPITQQPRRGRPPKEDEEPQEQFEYQIQDAPQQPQAVPAAPESKPREVRTEPPKDPEETTKKRAQPRRISVPETPEQTHEDSSAQADDILQRI